MLLPLAFIILFGPGLAFLLRLLVGGGTAYLRARWPFVIGYYALLAIPIALEVSGRLPKGFAAVTCTLLAASPAVSLYLLTWSRPKAEPRGFDVLMQRPNAASVPPAATEQTRRTDCTTGGRG
jgi:hypothetical protein